MAIKPWKFILKPIYIGKLKHTEFSKCEKVCAIVGVINKSIKLTVFWILNVACFDTVYSDL